ncbi:MAG: DUF4832 domain-containing protein [Kiritimatiellae bacterium]|nr:DUF4832 domain-containing protein [Kiritimatiellia bacterium]
MTSKTTWAPRRMRTSGNAWTSRGIQAVFAAAVGAAAVLGASAEMVTLHPQATREALINPGMGFCYYAYAGRLWAYSARNRNYDTLDWFPGCSTVYMRLLWSDLEPEEGDFRWDVLDRLAQPWIAKGKKIAVRVICCNQTANATPDYVRDAGAKGIWFTYDHDGAVKKFPQRWEPDYADPVFLEKFGRFLDAFAARYDGDPSVAFVDIGSFGIFGEGHSKYLGQLRKKDPKEFDRQVAMHLDLWRKKLPNTYLVVSDDVCGARNPDPDHPNMKKARDMGIGFRDDSIFCYRPPDYWTHAHWARNFAPTLPVVIETGHYSIIGYDGRWNTDLLLKCVEDHRASYFSIHDYPAEHLKLFRSQIEEINLRLGYRFVLKEVSYPSEVEADSPVAISSTWLNAGVAICYAGATLAWSLVDDAGHVCWSVTDGSFDFKSLEPTLEGKEHPVKVVSRVRFGRTVKNPDPDNCLVWARDTGRDPGVWNVMLPSGTYTLCVSAGTRQGTPVIALPLKDGRADRRYPLGRIIVRDAAALRSE